MKVFEAVCVSAVLALVSSQAHAVDVNGVSGGFLMGVTTQHHNALSGRLLANNLPGFSNAFVTLGGTAQGFYRGCVLGLEGSALFANGTSRDSLESSITGDYFIARLGYTVVAWRNLVLYPLVGIGIANTSLTIHESTSAAYLTSKFTARSTIMDVALAADYVFTSQDDENQHAGVVCGIRFGYAFSPHTDTWKAQQLSGIPGTVPLPLPNLRGPYFRLSIGAGWVKTPYQEYY